VAHGKDSFAEKTLVVRDLPRVNLDKFFVKNKLGFAKYTGHSTNPQFPAAKVTAKPIVRAVARSDRSRPAPASHMRTPHFPLFSFFLQ
jgi:hypothetical protein